MFTLTQLSGRQESYWQHYLQRFPHNRIKISLSLSILLLYASFTNRTKKAQTGASDDAEHWPSLHISWALFREKKILKAMATSLTLNTMRSIGLAHNHDLVIVSTADINEDRHRVSISYCCTKRNFPRICVNQKLSKSCLILYIFFLSKFGFH